MLGGIDEGVGAEEAEEEEKGFFGRLCDAINSNDPHSAVEEDAATRDIHDAAEVFDERTEGVFRYLQVRSPPRPPHAAPRMGNHVESLEQTP